MKNDAEKYADEDKKKREEVDARNEADALVVSIDKLLKDSADKISEDHKTKLESGKEELQKAIQDGDIEAIKAKKEEVQTVVYEVSAELYKQNPEEAAANAEGATGDANAEEGSTEKSSENNDDNVVDAEFSEVKK